MILEICAHDPFASRTELEKQNGGHDNVCFKNKPGWLPLRLLHAKSRVRVANEVRLMIATARSMPLRRIADITKAARWFKTNPMQ